MPSPPNIEMLWEQLQDMKTEIKELNQRMDRLETRLDNIETCRNNSGAKRRLLPNISSLDLWYISVALGTIYALILK